MRKNKIRPLPLVGGFFILLILWFIGTLQIKGAKERYCLTQTHLQFPFDKPMQGEKLEYFGGCFKEQSFTDAIKLIFSNNEDDYQKAKRIAELKAIREKNPNKDSQQYQEAQQELCLLTARPAEDREQAVSNIRQFLGKPDVPVEFLCSRFNSLPNERGTDYNSPSSEYYEAANWMFTIDPGTNYIVEMREAERRWGYNEDGSRWHDPAPEYDQTVTYTTEAEIKPVAEQFMKDHQDVLGVDIDHYTYEFEGTKPGNFFLQWIDYETPYTEEYEQCGDTDPTLEGAYQRDDGVWCAPVKNTRYPTVSMTINQAGQVVVYDNDGWEIGEL